MLFSAHRVVLRIVFSIHRVVYVLLLFADSAPLFSYCGRTYRPIPPNSLWCGRRVSKKRCA